MNVTPENITTLEANQVFVFGSNLAGRHGAGAALLAKRRFGAKNGIGEGLTGRCYAFPTKGRNLEVEPMCSLQVAAQRLHFCVMDNRDRHFLVTKVGCGLAGRTPEQMAPIFEDVAKEPNVSLPREFWDILNKSRP